MIREGKLFHRFVKNLLIFSERNKNVAKYKIGAAKLAENLQTVVRELENFGPKLEALYKKQYENKT